MSTENQIRTAIDGSIKDFQAGIAKENTIISKLMQFYEIFSEDLPVGVSVEPPLGHFSPFAFIVRSQKQLTAVRKMLRIVLGKWTDHQILIEGGSMYLTAIYENPTRKDIRIQWRFLADAVPDGMLKSGCRVEKTQLADLYHPYKVVCDVPTT